MRIAILPPDKEQRRQQYVCVTRDYMQPCFSVRCGDILILKGETNCRIQAKNPLTGESFILPRDVVTDIHGKSIVFDAWESIDRDGADRLLSMYGVEHGTFILRPSSDNKSIGLSVRQSNQSLVEHYKIELNKDKQYHLKPSPPFERLFDLITYYMENPGCLKCTRLKPYHSSSNGMYSTPESGPEVLVKGLKIFITKVLKTGDFSKVYRGSYHTHDVAVKCFNLSTNTSMLCKDLQYLKSLDFCVKVFDVFTDHIREMGSQLIVVMQMMDHGSLKHFLTTPEAKTMPFSSLLDIVRMIANGMEYLERNEIVHTNLKDTNVLLDCDGNVKLADVGIRGLLAKIKGAPPEMFAFDCWSAPELKAHPTNFTFKSDVWAFGILGYVVLTRGEEPYCSKSVSTNNNFLSSL
ncbi:unnamed protein product [Hydatigera taeniaeformis]|uniref:Tyrosine-protein kinase n=1 Tax=Hydatigena taeniaeformis TaxID=6205 RepID=A0A0R3WPW5_HYDTA|nr:unnamed protein product [Hydatigera taeniaeformis]